MKKSHITSAYRITLEPHNYLGSVVSGKIPRHSLLCVLDLRNLVPPFAFGLFQHILSSDDLIVDPSQYLNTLLSTHRIDLVLLLLPRLHPHLHPHLHHLHHHWTIINRIR